jgi:hypothetical protein
MRSLAYRRAAIVALFILACLPAQSQIQFFTDRAAFIAALSELPTTDDFESYLPGDIALGDRRGDFLYSSDQNITQAAIVAGGNGGQALGGSPFDVFVGGDSVTLDFSSLTLQNGGALRAFGADILYAPAFDAIPADIYRLVIGDGAYAGEYVANLDDLDPSGGTFFLGALLTPGDLSGDQAFKRVKIVSVVPTDDQGDPTFLVPAYQVDDLIYAAVPEPSSISMLAIGGIVLMSRLRRRK